MKLVAPRSAWTLALFVILIVVSCIAFFLHTAPSSTSVVTFVQPDQLKSPTACHALYVTMQGDGQVQVDSLKTPAAKYTRDAGLAAIKQQMLARSERTVYIRADRDVPVQDLSDFSASVRATADGVNAVWATDKVWNQARTGCGLS
ncbi:ExbD/TolR family protein [Silvibacterium sp.]|uniref:ExbD/TolR family protein n=1 Tax=Silvibacterium sp. TaxID=1964179 RepID=UPI0039E33C6C